MPNGFKPPVTIVLYRVRNTWFTTRKGAEYAGKPERVIIPRSKNALCEWLNEREKTR